MEALWKLDGNILLWIQENVRQDWMTPIVRFITHLGDRGQIWITLILIMLLFKKTRELGGLSAISIITSFLVNNVLLKNLVARVRPYEVVDGLQRLIGRQADASFPSGHTANSFAVATVILLRTPKRIGIPVFALALLIALSRLYLGVHYPTDVLGGMITGIGIPILVCKFEEYYKKKKEV